MASVAVGIDLGTTNSVVAISQGGRPRVLRTPEGAELIPSVVSFHPNGQTLVGAAARARRAIDPANTVFSVKRLLGRPFDSEEVRRACARFPFELREGPDAQVLVHTRAGDLSLPEISALVLREIRRVAEHALGERVERAVVTVPANFNELQRTATKMAGQIADLDVIRILNEPTAAALAYGYGRGTREKIAVYDFGGGTFDVTLLELSGNVFEVLATAGDTFLGGDDIDLLLTENLADGLLQALHIDARQDLRTFELLRAAAEQAKIELSTQQVATIRIPEIGYGPGGRPLEFKTRITRPELEHLAAPLIDRTIEVCSEALKLAGLRPHDFDSVILVGGSSRMPAVRNRVAQFFGREPLTSLPPEQVVGLGAAILAEALSGGGRRARSTQARTEPERSAHEKPTAVAPATTTSPSASMEGVGGVMQPGASVDRTPSTSPARPSELSWGSNSQRPPAPSHPPPSDPFTDSDDEVTRVHSVEKTPEGASPSRRSQPPSAAGHRVPPPLPSSPESLRGSARPPPLPAAPTLRGHVGARTAVVPAAVPPPVPALGDLSSGAPVSAGATSVPSSPSPSARSLLMSMLDAEIQAQGQATAPTSLGDDWQSVSSTSARSALPPALTSSPTVPAAATPGTTPPALPLLLDVTPHSLGVETIGGLCEVVIPRNTTIPVEQTREFATAYDGQEGVRIRIAQGESRRFDENQLLGELELLGITRAPRGEVTIAVTFELDANGTLNVRAREVATGRQTQTRVVLRAMPTEAELASMVQRQRGQV